MLKKPCREALPPSKLEVDTDFKLDDIIIKTVEGLVKGNGVIY